MRHGRALDREGQRLPFDGVKERCTPVGGALDFDRVVSEYLAAWARRRHGRIGR